MSIHEACINCLICINYCPLQKNPYLSLFTYPQLLANADREKLHGYSRIELKNFCLSCRLCEIVCPRNIKITKAVMELRKKTNYRSIGGL